MNYKDIMMVAYVNAATYDKSSKLAHEFPGKEHFTDATDLKILGKTDHLAVFAKFCNLRTFNPKPKGVSTTLTFILTASGSDEPDCRRSVPLKIKRSEFDIAVRVDFPLCTDHSKALLHYVLTIECDNGEILYELPLRLYDLTVLKVLPTKFYSAETAEVTDPEASVSRPLKSLGKKYNNCATKISFSLSSSLPDEIDLPELQLNVTHPDGSKTAEYLRPSRNSGIPGHITASSLMYFKDEADSGIYYAELRSMGYPIAGFVFSTDGDESEGQWSGSGLEPIKPYTPGLAEKRLKPSEQPAAESDCTLTAAESHEPCIDDLIGLSGVKARLHSYTHLMRFNQLRIGHGLPSMPISLHAMFLGSPGTGKTTVAKIIGKTLHDIGILSSGHVVVRERANLLGQYYHSESENVNKALEEARGGILLIDEAYQLYQPDDPKDPGKFVIESLLTALADESDRDWMLILAGYPQPMKRMFEMNPGLRSRIPPSNIYTFDDFTAPELMDIARTHLRRYRFTLSREAEIALRNRLEADYAARNHDFGNARHVISLIENDILPAMAARLSSVTSPDCRALSRIMASDIPAPADVSLPQIRRLGFVG